MDLLREETDKFGWNDAPKNRNGQASWLACYLWRNSSKQLEVLRLTATSRQVSRAVVLEARLALSLQEGRPRQHVQDLVAGQGALIYKMWQDQGGSLYVCGKVAMARGVQVQRSLAGKGW